MRSVLLAACLLLGLATVVLACRREPPLPVLGAVPAFTLTDQAGAPFTSDGLRGKVWAAAFVFTRCPMVCPRVTRAMRALQVKAEGRGVTLQLVSFSVDPENDTPEVLRRYATRYGANLATWSFVTGDADLVRRTAEQGFKIAVDGKADPSRVDFGITHGTQLVLVDGELRIRGYYASADEKALEGLLSDAARLAR